MDFIFHRGDNRNDEHNYLQDTTQKRFIRSSFELCADNIILQCSYKDRFAIHDPLVDDILTLLSHV